MIDDRAAFLAAICEAPDDARPRLIFADWLDEHGEPERAEFIRLQIRIAQFVPPVRGEECTEVSASWCPNCGDCSCRDRAERMDDPGCPLHAPDSIHDVSLDDLRRRERELYATSADWLLPELPDVLAGVVLEDERYILETGGVDGEAIGLLSRGFVSEITCAWDPEHITAIRKATPLRRVRLTAWPTLPGGAGFDAETTLQALVAEFPGVEFKLPVTFDDFPMPGEAVPARR